MTQSRFFYSSLNEVQLNIKEIFSLQVDLRQKILVSKKKQIFLEENDEQNIVPNVLAEIDIQGPSNFQVNEDRAIFPAHIADAIQTTDNSLNWAQVKKSDQAQNPHLVSEFANTDTRSKPKLYKEKIGVDSANETSKNQKKINRTLKIVLLFLMWEVLAILLFIYLAL